MLPFVLAAVCFVAVLGGIAGYGWRHYEDPQALARRLGGPVAESGMLLAAPSRPPGKTGLRFLRGLGKYVPVTPADAALVRIQLVQAGIRSVDPLPLFYGLKIAAAVALLIAAFLVRDALTANPVLRVVLVVVAAAGGFCAPAFVLARLIARRQKRLRLSLPDALDLMVVSVEAGLGLDQAILNVSRELLQTHRDISEELSLINLEMRAGKRRADALRNLAQRTGEPEIRKLVAILIQSDRFGTSIGESLRTHSDFMRVRRRQEAEERAGKVGVKLVFPIFFLILPSMMVVAAGPGLLLLFKHLFPMMKNFGH